MLDNNVSQGRQRLGIAGLTLSAVAFVSIVTGEGYTSVAVPPIRGDVCTNGFGTTQGIKCGDKTDPVKATQRALIDVQKDEAKIKQCVTVPLYQYEYDAYAELTYNIGASAFCHSTIVVKLNTQDYAGACTGILAWDKFKGKPLPGLTKRRQREYHQCIGEQS